MAKNVNLHKANRAKQDEFYTQLDDIAAEMRHYREQFRGKVIFCNCDDPYESNFFKYFALNFNFLGLKKLIATCYTGSPVMGMQLALFDIEGMPEQSGNGKSPYKIEITEVPDINSDGAVDLADVEFLLKSKRNALTLLGGDGDFRSEECIELLKQADIVVTNPPFSLFREYVAQLVEYDKKFIIIGSKNAVTYKEIFPLIAQNKLWTGFRPFSGGMWFISDYIGKYEKIIDGIKLINVPAIWYTNLDHLKRHEFLILYKHYTPEEYPHYDNYDAINVDKVTDIPMDYNGVMGVPITFLDKYSPEQFEILGIANSARWIDYECYTIINGRKVYNRLLIKRK